MLKRNLLLVVGLALYAASYALPAVSSAGATGAVHGYLCAWLTVRVPWGPDGMNVLHDTPLIYFAILLTGWINPAFLIATALLFTRRWPRLATVFRVLCVVLIPFSWYVLYQQKLVPRVGHYLWIASMLLVMFSNELTGVRRVPTNVRLASEK